MVMATCNRADFLSKSVESILAQTLKDFEFIIVNDGSTDGTAKILDEYAAKDSRIRIITQENQGLAASRNNGVAIARGKYVAFMDDDDASGINRLEAHLDFLRRHPSYHACKCDILSIDEYYPGIGSSGIHEVGLEIKSSFDYKTKRYIDVLGPTSFIEKKTFNDIGGYRQGKTIIEDLDFTLRYRRRFHWAVMTGNYLYFYTFPSDNNAAESLSNQDVHNFVCRYISCFVSDWCYQNKISDPVEEGKEQDEILAILSQIPWFDRYRIYWTMKGILNLFVIKKGLSINQGRWYLLGLLKFPYPIKLAMLCGMILVQSLRRLRRNIR